LTEKKIRIRDGCPETSPRMFSLLFSSKIDIISLKDPHPKLKSMLPAKPSFLQQTANTENPTRACSFRIPWSIMGFRPGSLLDQLGLGLACSVFTLCARAFCCCGGKVARTDAPILARTSPRAAPTWPSHMPSRHLPFPPSLGAITR
jgi:hypothetical protein